MVDLVWKWELCPMCGPMIICPECGMNTCSGGSGEINGQDCPVCLLAHAECLKAYDENRVPRLPGDTPEEREKARDEAFNLFTGGKPVTLDDLLNL